MTALPRKKYQVFVSSTYNDLKEERQEAVSAILKAGHIPAGMELFTAGNQSQLEVIKRWIDDSDIYMLILGTRYGAIEPTTGLSYTEVEYDYAISLGKPIFSVVLNEGYRDAKLKELGVTAAENENSGSLIKFREKVMAVMCSIVKELKDIRGAVYENLIEVTANNDLIGWVSASLLEDTRPYRDQISSLESENERLKADLDERRIVVSDQPTTSTAVDAQFESLRNILRREMKLPADISKTGKEEDRKVGGLFLANKNLLIRGWNFSPPSPAINKWFEKNVIPDLIVHRLVAKTDGATGRKYTVTEKGLDFLAWMDERLLEEKALHRPKAGSPATTNKTPTKSSSRGKRSRSSKSSS